MLIKDLIILIKIFLRENFTFKSHGARINEPTMAMAFEAQVYAFGFASSPEGALAPVQAYAALNASKTIKNAKKIIDLGCGTGHVLTKMAYINPDKYFYALDLSPKMLEEAKKLADSMCLRNIEFHLGDMTDLSKFKNLGIDAVTSSLALHHLRSPEDLTKVFCEIEKLVGGSGSFAIIDMGRFKFYQSILDILSLHKHDLPVLTEETINSYLAAFPEHDFKRALKISGLDKNSKLSIPLFIPSFIKMNTEQRELSPLQKKLLKELIDQLSTPNKFFFKIMKLFFLI